MKRYILITVYLLVSFINCQSQKDLITDFNFVWRVLNNDLNGKIKDLSWDKSIGDTTIILIQSIYTQSNNMKGFILYGEKGFWISYDFTKISENIVKINRGVNYKKSFVENTWYVKNLDFWFDKTFICFSYEEIDYPYLEIPFFFLQDPLPIALCPIHHKLGLFFILNF